MSSHERGNWETPDEVHLASLMNRASDFMVPIDGYSMDLKLYGILPSKRIVNELEAQFNTRLDRTKGSHLWLATSPSSRRLELNHFSADLIGECGKIALQRTKIGDVSPHEFIPSVEFLGKNIEARSYTWEPEWQKGFLDKLTREHGIDTDLPVDSAALYHMWLGHTVLSRTTAWSLNEKLQLAQQSDEIQHATISVGRHQTVPEDTLLSSETLSIIHETTDKESGVTDTLRLDLISHQDERHFARTTIRTDAYNKMHDQESLYGPNADDIAYFTQIIEKTLSPES